MKIRVFCGVCSKPLGTYEAEVEDGRVWSLRPVALPRGMVAVQPGEPRPKGLSFVVEIRGGQPAVVKGRNGMTAAYGGLAKYRWRCGCGHNPVRRAETLAADISRQGGLLRLI